MIQAGQGVAFLGVLCGNFGSAHEHENAHVLIFGRFVERDSRHVDLGSNLKLPRLDVKYCKISLISV